MVPASLPAWVEAIASDPLSGSLPAAVEASHLKRHLSYSQLNALSLKIAQALKNLLPRESFGGSRPVCLHMHRSVDWLATYIACVRIGVPIVCASRDLPDKDLEDSRYEEIISILDPILIISDEKRTVKAGGGLSIDVLLKTPPDDSEPPLIELNYLVGYHFTGGTSNSHSKCVKITNSMVTHELRTYPSILRTSEGLKKVLQNSSLFWPASAFGQLNIALAFKACVVLTVKGGASAEEVSQAVTAHQIDCIGVVPSVLRSLPDLPSLRTVFTWGETLPKTVASSWCLKAKLIDLLIATEYWLSFFAIVGPDWKQTYSIVDYAEVRLLPSEDGSRRDTLFISGPMVTPGYVDSKLTECRFRTIDKKKFFCTNDALSLKGSEWTFRGRTDDLQKVGGKFVDLSLARTRIIDALGSNVARDCAVFRNTRSDNIAVCIVLASPSNLGSLIQTAQECLPGILPGDVHAVSELPRNAGTGKVDKGKLCEKFSSCVFASDYTLPDSEVQESKLLGLPNPHRWAWIALLCVLFSVNWTLLFSLILSLFYRVVESLCVPATQFIYFPFVSHALFFTKHPPKSKWRATKKCLEKAKKIFHELPGDVPFVAIAVTLVGSLFPLSILTELIAVIGALRVPQRDLLVEYLFASGCGINIGANVVFFMLDSRVPFPIIQFLLFFVLSGTHGLKRVSNHMLLTYVNLPWDLAWAWTCWWRDVPSYWSLGLYYGRALDALFKESSWFLLFRVPAVGLVRFFSTWFHMHDRSGYSKGYAKRWESDRTYPCDLCTKCTSASRGAFDTHGKFSADTSLWFCENCWWGNVGDVPRIGFWSKNWICGKMRTLINIGSGNKSDIEEVYSDEDLLSTRDPSECEHSDDDGANPFIRKACLESLAFIGWDEACIAKSGLAALSSLSKTQVHHQLRKRIPQLSDASVVALFKDVYSLNDLVRAVAQSLNISREQATVVSSADPPTSLEDGTGTYRVFNSSAGMWASGACDWLLSVKVDGIESDKIESQFTKAIKSLKKKHPALRAKPLDDTTSAAWLQQAVGLSPEGIRSAVIEAAVEEWPRIKVNKFCESDPVPLSFVYLEKLTKARVNRMANEHRGSVFIPPFECVVFLSSSSASVNHTAYVYFRVTHMFADGSCLHTIAEDLENFLSDPHLCPCSVPTMNAFEVLQNRLLSLVSSPGDTASPNLAAATEELNRDYTLVQVMWVQNKTVQSLTQCASRLGLPTEILIMGLVTAALADKLEWNRMPISLMHSLRDGPNEHQMVGFFSDYRDLGFFDTQSSYLELFHQLAVRVRNRDWRIPTQKNYDHCYGRHAWDASLFPVSFNLLPHPRRKGSVQPLETYWRSKPRYGQQDCRLIHVYIEESRSDKEWAIRMHFNRRLFDCTWIVDFVCRSMDKAIRQVLGDPTQRIL